MFRRAWAEPNKQRDFDGLEIWKLVFGEGRCQESKCKCAEGLDIEKSQSMSVHQRARTIRDKPNMSGLWEQLLLILFVVSARKTQLLQQEAAT